MHSTCLPDKIVILQAGVSGSIPGSSIQPQIDVQLQGSVKLLNDFDIKVDFKIPRSQVKVLSSKSSFLATGLISEDAYAACWPK